MSWNKRLMQTGERLARTAMRRAAGEGEQAGQRALHNWARQSARHPENPTRGPTWVAREHRKPRRRGEAPKVYRGWFVRETWLEPLP